jgi:hypothetical protein
MLLYAHCINPLLTALHATLPGKYVGRKQKHASLTAYVEDVAVYVTSPDDIPKLCEVLGTYESAIGAQINKGKSRIRAFGNWNTSLNILGIPYHAP